MSFQAHFFTRWSNHLRKPNPAWNFHWNKKIHSIITAQSSLPKESRIPHHTKALSVTKEKSSARRIPSSSRQTIPRKTLPEHRVYTACAAGFAWDHTCQHNTVPLRYARAAGHGALSSLVQLRAKINKASRLSLHAYYIPAGELHTCLQRAGRCSLQSAPFLSRCFFFSCALDQGKYTGVSDFESVQGERYFYRMYYGTSYVTVSVEALSKTLARV